MSDYIKEYSNSIKEKTQPQTTNSSGKSSSSKNVQESLEVKTPEEWAGAYNNWSAEREILDQQYIDDERARISDFDNLIKEENEDYINFSDRPKYGKASRKAIRDAYHQYHFSEYSLFFREAFSLENKSLSKKHGQYLYSNEQPNIGNALGLYYSLKMSGGVKQSENNNIKFTDLKEKSYDYQIQILDHIKENSQTYLDEMKSADNDTLIRNWPLYDALFKLSNLDEHKNALKTINSDQNSETKSETGKQKTETKRNLLKDATIDPRKIKLNSYKDVLDSIGEMKAELEARMNMLSSYNSDKIDFDGLSEMTSDDITNLNNEYEKRDTSFGAKNESFNSDLPFKSAKKYYELLMKRLKKEVLIQATGKEDGAVIVTDTEGQTAELDKMILSGKPFFVIDQNAPEKAPQLMMKGGSALVIGTEKVREKLDAKIREQEELSSRKKPKGFAAGWDGFCKALGLQSWRTKNAIDYERWEQKNELNDLRNAQDSISEASFSETLKEVEKKKPEIKDAVSYIRAKEIEYRNAANETPSAEAVYRYEMAKSLAETLEWIKGGENKAGTVKELGDLLKEFDADKTDEFLEKLIKSRAELVKNSEIYKKIADNLKEVDHDEAGIVNEAVESSINEIAKLDAFKIILPAKNLEESTQQLYYEAQGLTENVVNTLKNIREELRKDVQIKLNPDYVVKTDAGKEPNPIAAAMVNVHIINRINECLEDMKTSYALSGETDYKALIKIASEKDSIDRIQTFINETAADISGKSTFSLYNNPTFEALLSRTAKVNASLEDKSAFRYRIERFLPDLSMVSLLPEKQDKADGIEKDEMSKLLSDKANEVIKKQEEYAKGSSISADSDAKQKAGDPALMNEKKKKTAPTPEDKQKILEHIYNDFEKIVKEAHEVKDMFPGDEQEKMYDELDKAFKKCKESDLEAFADNKPQDLVKLFDKLDNAATSYILHREIEGKNSYRQECRLISAQKIGILIKLVRGIDEMTYEDYLKTSYANKIIFDNCSYYLKRDAQDKGMGIKPDKDLQSLGNSLRKLLEDKQHTAVEEASEDINKRILNEKYFKNEDEKRRSLNKEVKQYENLSDRLEDLLKENTEQTATRYSFLRASKQIRLAKERKQEEELHKDRQNDIDKLKGTKDVIIEFIK